MSDILRRLGADVLNYDHLPLSRQNIISDILFKDIRDFKKIQKEYIEKKQ